MTTIVDWQAVDGEQVAQALQGIGEKLNGGEGEVLLDFSKVRRLDPAGLLAIENLATAAAAKSVKVTLRGVNVGVYKVLKLARLTARFSFVN